MSKFSRTTEEERECFAGMIKTADLADLEGLADENAGTLTELGDLICAAGDELPNCLNWISLIIVNSAIHLRCIADELLDRLEKNGKQPMPAISKQDATAAARDLLERVESMN